MTRITTTVLIMTLLLNGTATIMEVSGLNDDLGVEIQTGVDDVMSDIVDELDGAFSPEVSVIESFVGLAVAAGQTFRLVIEGVFAAPTLVLNLLGGSAVVDAVVTAFFAPMYVISTLELVSLVLGNRTV